MLAIRIEAFVESDGALGRRPVERQNEEDLLRHSLRHKSGRVFEPEFPVVIRVAHETTSLSIPILQIKKPFLDQRFPDTLPLVRRQHRNGSQSIPVRGTVGNGHGRESYLAYHSAICFRDE